MKTRVLSEPGSSLVTVFIRAGPRHNATLNSVPKCEPCLLATSRLGRVEVEVVVLVLVVVPPWGAHTVPAIVANSVISNAAWPTAGWFGIFQDAAAVVEQCMLFQKQNHSKISRVGSKVDKRKGDNDDLPLFREVRRLQRPHRPTRPWISAPYFTYCPSIGCRILVASILRRRLLASHGSAATVLPCTRALRQTTFLCEN